MGKQCNPSGISATNEQFATVVVIGAGQAGLSAAYHLQQRGFRKPRDTASLGPTFVVLDKNLEPGGAWQHRWDTLTMRTVNGIFDLPDFPKPEIDPAESSNSAVPRYFAAFEAHMHLPIVRPVSVSSIRYASASSTADFIVTTDSGIWRASAIINATGTWNNPVLPHFHGSNSFTGEQLHARNYVSSEAFAQKKVAIVGGGISAVQLLEEISRTTEVLWYTRREPVFMDGAFRAENEGREVIRKVTSEAEQGNPQRSVVSYTGLIWTPYAVAAKERGVLKARPMFTALEPNGVREANGSFTAVDVILWATGYRADLAHLAPLRLRNRRGGIAVRGTQVADDPRVHLIGFGPSQSTVGANRAGRDAARRLARQFNA